VLADGKDDLEVRLHERVRDLFNQQLDPVLYDTTSVSFQSAGQDALRRRGHSRDRRADLPRTVLGLLLSADGLPIGHELFPGNTYDGNTVPGVLDRLRGRFQLRWLIFVGDRGMVSEKSLWRVERAFRTLKSPLELRPVRHWSEPRIRGHMVVCFLAFLIRTALERRLFEEADIEASVSEVMDALHRVQQVRVEVKGIPLQLVTEPPALAREAFGALGIRPPPRLRKLA
jgi:transposase